MKVTAELLLTAYTQGIFPMADDRTGAELQWYDPNERGILPLEGFHIPKRLQRTIRTEPYQVTYDTCFSDVMAACARSAPGRETTWINAEIESLYAELNRSGFAHSIEVWSGEDLVGGLYGVHIGAAFFGESMFSTMDDASKIALVYLVARLKAGGFRLLDTQFVTDHLLQFGAMEIPRAEYKTMLEKVVQQVGDFHQLPADAPPSAILQSSTQTS